MIAAWFLLVGPWGTLMLAWGLYHYLKTWRLRRGLKKLRRILERDYGRPVSMAETVQFFGQEVAAMMIAEERVRSGLA